LNLRVLIEGKKTLVKMGLEPIETRVKPYSVIPDLASTKGLLESRIDILPYIYEDMELICDLRLLIS
jgi:hypothetical protein